MLPLFVSSARLAALFLLFVSFWPWEKDPGETKKSSLEIPRGSPLLEVVRVALFYEKSRLLLKIPAPYEIREFPGGRPLRQGPLLPPTVIRPEAQGIRVGAEIHPVSALRVTSENQEVEVENRKYHNAIQLLKNPRGSLTVVNEIAVEDYLRGVLPWEVKPDWPQEALKAQAVVSRTYAIFKNIENQEFPFTLSDDVGSQVYKGKELVSGAVNRAVDRTRGEILTYRGRVFPAFFHSTCGGRTTRAEEQWKIKPHPSLEGVECSFCRASPYSRWRAEYTSSETEKLLAKKGFSVTGLREVRPGEPDVSGRPRFFVVSHSQGSLKVPANDFRLALGVDRLRSTRVKVERRGDLFVFEGRGWGHGVGMCQFGAKWLAELGYSYTDILRYYYPGSEVRGLEDFLLSPEEDGREENGRNIFQSWYEELKSFIEDL